MVHQSIILIVDDESIGRDTLEALLISQGYTLVFAGDGPEALAKAAELTPDLILLDVMMPGMNGFEVCRRLRTNPLLAEVPIIMITALDDRDSRLQGITAGADDFITKPVDPAELRVRVQTITRLNRYRRLLLERAKLEWVVEQTDDGYLMVNASDMILYANPRARLYLGLPGDDKGPILGTFLDSAKKHYHCTPQEVWTTWPLQGGDLEMPRYLVRPESPTADVFWLQVNLMEMASRAEKQYLIRLRDITPNVVVRDNLWTSHALISHKLKTPLTLLTGSLELLHDISEGDFSAQQKQYMLSTARKRALEIRDEIMRIFEYMEAPDVTKPGQGRCCLAMIPLITANVKAGLELKSVTISYQKIHNPDQVYVQISSRAIELILWELLENARKFHPQQSPTLEINLSRRAGTVCIQICDDGLVLSPEQLAKIWIPYYQAERGFSGQVPGMGLGLSMVASLIWRVGKTCRAYNREERPGVVIEFELPVANCAV